MADRDPRDDDPFAEDDFEDNDLGTLGGAFDEAEIDAMMDQIIGEDVLDAPPEPPRPGVTVDPPAPQPCNQATMACLRGPCIHLWQLVSRYPEPGDELRVKRLRVCTASGLQETELAEQNIYDCDRWWPRWLAFMPQSIRGAVRTPFRNLWERILRVVGYDFSWRTFPLNVFESDNPEQRKHSGLGKGPASYWRYDHDVATTTGHGAEIPEGGEL